MGRGVLCLLWFLAISTPALAAPIVYFFDSGSAAVTATRTSDLSLVVDTTIGLDGVFVTFDAVLGELTDFSITAPLSGAIPMLQTWGGFDTFVVESASIVPGGTYSSIFVSMLSPTTFSFLVGPVDVAGVYGAAVSGLNEGARQLLNLPGHLVNAVTHTHVIPAFPKTPTYAQSFNLPTHPAIQIAKQS